MNAIEQQIFAATYAAAFEREWHWRTENRGIQWAMENTSGYSAARVAGEAVKKYREALASEDGQYLLCNTENWPLAT